MSESDKNVPEILARPDELTEPGPDIDQTDVESMRRFLEDFPMKGLSPMMFLLARTQTEADPKVCPPGFKELFSSLAATLSAAWVGPALYGDRLAGRRLAMLAQDLVLLGLPFPKPLSGFMLLAFDRIRRGEDANKALHLNRRPGRQPILPEDRLAKGQVAETAVTLLMGSKGLSRTAAVRALAGDGETSTPTDQMRRLWEILAEATELAPQPDCGKSGQ